MPPKALQSRRLQPLARDIPIASNLYLRVQGASRTYAFRYHQPGNAAKGHRPRSTCQPRKRGGFGPRHANLFHNGKLQAPPSKTKAFAEASRKDQPKFLDSGLA